ncbi:hypothetical protein VPH35_013687 [Triticum aestivum]
MAEWYMASWKLSVSTIRARSCRAFSSVRPPTNDLPAFSSSTATTIAGAAEQRRPPLASLGGSRRADPPGAHGARGGCGAGPESRSRRRAGGEGDGGCRRCHGH